MNNFIKIYFWQTLSIALNFVALFVVTPYLSSQPPLFGIYSIVTSLYIFLSYADLGFITAGMKYASESFAQNNRSKEIRIIGFVGFVFFIFVFCYSLVVGLLSLNPGFFVKNLSNDVQCKLASQLLLTLAIFAPVLVGQKVLQVIFGIRLQDYLFQRILSAFNLVKIISVLFFFSDAKYRIVDYFIFSQCCGLAAVLFGMYVAKRKLNYDLVLLFRSFRFDQAIYNQVSKLAFTSLFLTFCWILYYEIDLFIIGKFLGPGPVAIFAIGITAVTLFRTLFGVIFNPFIAKFNHFIGLGDKEGVKFFFFKVLILSIPLTVFPVVAITTTMKNFIGSWVGAQYESSVQVTQFLLLSYVFSFLSYPSGMLVMAYEKITTLLITNMILPLIYWIGIILTFSYLGLMSFAYFKFIAFLFSAIVYSVIVARIFEMKWKRLLIDVVLPSVPAVILLIGILLLLRTHLPIEKGKFNLLLVIGVNAFCIMLTTSIYYLFSLQFRNAIKEIFKGVMLKFHTKSRIV